MLIKNIIVYSKKLPPEHVGGIETNAYYLIRNLIQQKKYNVSVVSVGKINLGIGRRKKKKFDNVIVKVSYLKKSEIKAKKNLFRVFRANKYKPQETLVYHNTLDLHDNYPWLNELGYKQVARSGGNDIFYVEKSSVESNKLLANMKYLDRLIVNSAYSVKRSVEFGFDEKLLKVIKGGCEACANDLPGIGTLPTDRPVIVSCGRLVDFKGVDDALNALALVKEKVPNIFFAIVGDGELRSALEDQAAQLGLQSHCKFFGKVSPLEVQVFYRSATIYLSSSKDILKTSGSYQYIHTETMGRSICEAEINGVPVVSTDAGGSVEMLIDAKTGIVVPQGNVEQMAEAILKLLKNESLRKQYAEAARQFAQQEFGWDKVVFKTINLIEGLN